jgi:putative ATP-binding cassette transporter
VVSVSPDGMFSRTRGLSSGERKRLALLVALLQDRVVYLFDEWAADQDPVFKDIFYRSILPELKANAKLVIAITHDDRYFDLADQLVILERSRLPVVERQPKLFAGSMGQADDIRMSASLPI